MTARQHDNRITLTGDERETLEMLFDYALERLNNDYSGRTPTQMFAGRLARAKLVRLKIKLFPTTPTKEKTP